MLREFIALAMCPYEINARRITFIFQCYSYPKVCWATLWRAEGTSSVLCLPCMGYAILQHGGTGHKHRHANAAGTRSTEDLCLGGYTLPKARSRYINKYDSSGLMDRSMSLVLLLLVVLPSTSKSNLFLKVKLLPRYKLLLRLGMPSHRHLAPHYCALMVMGMSWAYHASFLRHGARLR